ncbi:MAG TPA: electron transfer flavoprotein subunit beta/FixA family protein [Candidatus Pullichristensenella stercorigallinarum]|uniref:Electron transfer flavoprotein small subunit n=1 Tax=Candidatus Pullichristensenella stercorigallinarum TaxID=2840909 RepID=A0A9D0ZLK9_9FIRM|nr:electron transfer flavoprotein subunit beta/FixA family protein [Candidatus Pullichristensenella stercorigallinarum]
MKITVCVKQVPAANEQRLDPVTGTVIREGVPSILNPFDAYALEEAVRLKERLGGEITVLSMGVPSAQETLRRALAVGADRAILLSGRAFAGADTLATARALAKAIGKAGGADLVLCGRMATDGDTAQVGPMLAEMLGVPHAADVSEIEAIDGGRVTLTRMTDDGYRREQLPLPALLTVVKEINVPRLPSVMGVLRGQAAEVTVWDAPDVGALPEETGQRGSRTRVVRTARPAKRAGCRMVDGFAALMDAIQGAERK